MPCGHDMCPDGTNHGRIVGDSESKAMPEEADMTQEMSQEEREQRQFFISMLMAECFKRMFEPDFDEASRDKCLEATGQL